MFFEDAPQDETSAYLRDPGTQQTACIEQYLACKTAEAEHIGAQESPALSCPLCELPLHLIRHMFRQQQNACRSKWRFLQAVDDGGEAVFRLAAACAASDEFEFSRHNILPCLSVLKSSLEFTSNAPLLSR